MPRRDQRYRDGSFDFVQLDIPDPQPKAELGSVCANLGCEHSEAVHGLNGCSRCDCTLTTDPPCLGCGHAASAHPLRSLIRSQCAGEGRETYETCDCVRFRDEIGPGPQDGLAAGLDLLLREGVDVTAGVQAEIWANKVAKGFNTTDVPMEVALLVAEIGEFVDAWKRGQTEAAAAELADIAIFTYGLAGILGVDLDGVVARKAAINEGRVYVARAHGHVEAGHEHR